MSRVFNSHIFLSSSILVRTLLLHKYNKKNQKNFFISLALFFKFDFLLLVPHQIKKNTTLIKICNFSFYNFFLFLQILFFLNEYFTVPTQLQYLREYVYHQNRRSSQILFYFLFYCKL